MIDWAGDDIVLALSSRPSVVGSWLPNFQGDVSSCDKRFATLNRISVVISNLWLGALVGKSGHVAWST